MTVNKYHFAEKTMLYMINDDLQQQRGAEIKFLLKDLEDFNISLKSLCSSLPKMKERDALLNTVFCILEDYRLVNFINGKKALPKKKISQISGELPQFISNNRDYLILYFIILSSDNYVYLKRYLSITESTFPPSKVDSNSSVGLILSHWRKGVLILTPIGEIKYVMYPNAASKVGEIIEVEKSKVHINKMLLVLFFIVALGISFFIANYIYKYPKSTVILEVKGTVTLNINKFNKVSSYKGSNSSNKKILEKCSLKDKTLDDSLFNLLTYYIDNEIIKPQDTVSIYITKNPVDFSSLEKTQGLLQKNSLDVNINNNGKDEFLSPKKDTSYVPSTKITPLAV